MQFPRYLSGCCVQCSAMTVHISRSHGHWYVRYRSYINQCDDQRCAIANSMATSLSTFIPTIRDVLVVVSHNAMGSSGLTHAFLFNPMHSDTGLLINRTGAVCEVGPEEWAELRRLASDAKDSVALGGGGSWSRPQWGSCPTNVFYDLGPADGEDLLPMFQLTGHQTGQITGGDIIHHKNGAREIVAEIPSPLVELAKASTAISQKLLPYTYSQTQPELSNEARQMLEAVQNMLTLVRTYAEGPHVGEIGRS
ncbi:hypothetical protein DFH09DRAFT_204189 [Mycena vulgaris]|nr:hypothetical protein DFH09DRAFT_204189 [Mycena vulgaris]